MEKTLNKQQIADVLLGLLKKVMPDFERKAKYASAEPEKADKVSLFGLIQLLQDFIETPTNDNAINVFNEINSLEKDLSDIDSYSVLSDFVNNVRDNLKIFKQKLEKKTKILKKQYSDSLKFHTASTERQLFNDKRKAKEKTRKATESFRNALLKDDVDRMKKYLNTLVDKGKAIVKRLEILVKKAELKFSDRTDEIIKDETEKFNENKPRVVYRKSGIDYIFDRGEVEQTRNVLKHREDKVRGKQQRKKVIRKIKYKGKKTYVEGDGAQESKGE